MINKLNFYDLYGYLLPGFVLTALFYFPFGFIADKWPEREWGSAIVGLALSYVLGVILQSIATEALPSTVPTAKGKERYPSDLVLDSNDSNLSSSLKTDLQALISRTFGL